MDYLLGLLEEAEAIAREEAARSLSLPQEEAPRRRTREETAGEAEKEAPLTPYAASEAAAEDGADPTEGMMDTGGGSRAEERLRQRLRQGAAEAPRLGGVERTDFAGGGPQSARRSEAAFLQTMQEKHRFSESMGAGRIFGLPEPLAQTSGAEALPHRAASDFDRVLERDARRYDQGFSLL